MSLAKSAVVAGFVLAAAVTVWWTLPGIVARVNTGTPAEIVITAAFPVLLTFFFLYMAFRVAFTREKDTVTRSTGAPDDYQA
ncbi:MAG: hypothetical protein AAFQ42_11475 [Pseudomonadota bacterium]